MRKLPHLFAFGLALMAPGLHAAAPAAADPSLGVTGVWVSSKGTIISVSRDGDELRGEVIAMRKPRPDRKNPDPELRERPVVGLQLLSDYRLRKGVWRGRLYDPGSGRNFASHLKLDDDGTLRLRGYFGFSLLGKTEVFEPVSNCTERIVELLRSARIEDYC